MAKTRVEIAEQLFENYAKNLNFYHPQFEHIFLCPLCLRQFPKNAIKSGELTLEHIIPSALGGKFITLTCKECNSKSGELLDAHLIQRLRTEDILTGKSNEPLKVRVNIGEGEFNGNIYLSDKENPNIRIVGNRATSNPNLHKIAVSEFKSGKQNFSISGNLSYKEIPSRVAVLRIAYLLAFSYFGYGYILYKNLEQIRTQIFQPEKETTVLKGMFWTSESPPANTIGVLESPQELRSFIAIINLSTDIERKLCVALPGLDIESETIYERWKMVVDSNTIEHNPNIDIIFFDPAYISDSDYKFLPARIWRKQIKIGNN